MGLFIGASILTVLELFDYAYEVSGVGCWDRATGGQGSDSHPPRHPFVPGHKTQAVQKRKCQKEAKRSSADKGVALSLNDVKRHVREQRGAPSSPTSLPRPPPGPPPCHLFSFASPTPRGTCGLQASGPCPVPFPPRTRARASGAILPG